MFVSYTKEAKNTQHHD